MQEIISFIDNVDNFSSEHVKKLRPSNIFSFNIFTHKFLEDNKIEHKIAENYLKEGDREKIFEYAINLWKWYDDDFFRGKFEFENISLLSIADTSEFHQMLIREIFNFFVIKRIIEIEHPKTIILSSHFAKIVKQIDNKISLEISDEQKHDFHMQWEKIPLRFNVLNRSISIPISRKRFNQFKKIFEFIIGNLFGLWQNFRNKKPSILFLEFNPVQYLTLLDNLKNFNGNIIFFNRRRPAGWNFSSIKILRKNNIKLISSELSISKKDKIKIDSSVDLFRKKLNELWLNESIFHDIFKIEEIVFWPIISDILFHTYEQRITEYLQLIQTSKKLFSELNITCIISLNVLGETEKTILAANNKKSPSILLEHGASNFLPTISKYDFVVQFPDKIALWGDIQNEYLSNHKKIPKDKIFVTGSTRHESFFNATKFSNTNTDKIILIAPQGLTEFHGNVDTNTYLRLEKLLTKIFEITNKLSNVKVIVKMHPTLDPVNAYVKTLIHKLDPNIQIFQLESVLDVINSCDVLLNINNELFPSTILYEGLILNKPIINIKMMDEEYEFELMKSNAVLSISDKDEFEESIKKILFDNDFRSQLIINGQKHLKRYFSHHLTASEKLADTLMTYDKK